MTNITHQGKQFLVEIRWKNWVYVPEGESRTIAYEIVTGVADDYYARHVGYDQFYAKLVAGEFPDVVSRNLTKNDFCAPDAVELD